MRGSEVNGFDIATCRGMQQVQEISDASIMKQLQLDESEWSDMVAEMRVANSELRKERDQYKEIIKRKYRFKRLFRRHWEKAKYRISKIKRYIFSI